jgi:hypothetical protein
VKIIDAQVAQGCARHGNIHCARLSAAVTWNQSATGTTATATIEAEEIFC